MSKSPSITLQTIRLFTSHALDYKRYLFPLLIGIPITVLIMDFLEPYILSLVLEKISTGNYDSSDLWASFGGYIIVYIIANLASGVAGWRINVWLVWNLELAVSRDMARKIFDHLIKMSPNFHSNRFAGSLVSQANKLTGAYVRFADSTFFSLYTLIIGVTATVAILAPRVPIYAAALVGFTIVFILGAIYFSKPVREANTRESEQQSRQTGNLADSLTNVMAIKSFSAEKYENNRYYETTTKTRLLGLRSIRSTTIRETYSSIVTSSLGIAALLIAVFGAQQFNTDIATLFLIVTYTGRIGERLWEFQNVLRNYNRAFGDASDMVKILAIEPEIKDPKNPEKSLMKKGHIVFEDVVFTHDEKDNALFEKININVKSGEKIGLVGHSGSGKTTFTRLLLRFSDIDDGKISIDSQDIRNVKQSELRKAITYVPQEPLLFHRSIAENISYGKENASDSEIIKASKLAHAHEFVKELPQGYETLVGERGVKLSGGQRQRIAIARAMIKNAPILVLDEATSALDSESERLIQDALWKLMEGRTAIVIAHRLSTVQRMDRIIVLKEGKIVEEGSHKELLKNNGVYAGLWAHQSGGFLED